MIPIYAGLTSQSIDVFIPDSGSTTGGGKTGLAFNTASLTAYYRKGATGTPTAITLATLANAQAAWSSGGFVEIDATNQPGMYRLDLPNAAVDTAGLVHVMLKGASGMAPVPVRIDCRALPADVKLYGGTAGTFSGGRPEIIIQNDGITAAKIAADAITAAKVAADVTTEIQSGLATASALSTVAGYIDTEIATIIARLPAALVSGRMDCSVGAMASSVMTAAALATDAVTEIQSGLAGAAALSALSLSMASLQTSVDTIGGYLDTEIAAILADTNELQTDWANGGRLDLLLDTAVADSTLARQILGNKHTVVESPAGTFTISVRNDADSANVRTIVYVAATGARTAS